MKRFIIILLTTIVATSVFAQDRCIEGRVLFNLPFYLSGAGKSHIRYDLDSMAIAKSLRDLDLLAKDTTSIIKGVQFYSSVSPEGSTDINARLSKIRIATTESIVRERLHLGDDIKISYKEQYTPWHQCIIPAVEADKSVPHREELLEVLYTMPKQSGPNTRYANILRADSNKLWRVLEERYFNHVRRGGAVITVDRHVYDNLLAVADPFGEGVLEVPTSYISAEHKEEVKPTSAISLKTNAAGVAVLIANLGVEFKLAQHWSLEVMGAYSPYNLIVKDRKIRLFGIRSELRYWWGEPMKRGHFLGLHGLTTAFNVQLTDKARYQDPNSAAWGVGLAYGYALPLGKKENWGVEFTLGLGFARIKYDKYDGALNGQFIERKRVNYFGPTRLGVNFSYRFDIEGKNKKRR